MKILIAEDDLASRKFLFKFMSQYGECDITVDGVEAVEAYMIALDENDPYDLVCLDIMMPKLDGIKALKSIREIEKAKEIPKAQKAKIIMITALSDVNVVNEAFDSDCEAYAAKPIDLDKLIEVMKKLQLIKL